MCKTLTENADFPSWPNAVFHSHRELEKIRRIRNELERRGPKPLLFFPECQKADDARLFELIRDEIKARAYFVLCNTRASRRSKWMKQEIERVKQVTQRPRQTVAVMNLERDLQTELLKLSKPANVLPLTCCKNRKSWNGFGAYHGGTTTMLSVWFESALWRRLLQGEWPGFEGATVPKDQAPATTPAASSGRVMSA